MRADVPTITKEEYKRFKKGETIKVINDYFSLILSELPEELKSEAQNKGFELVEGGKSMDILTLNIIVPNASSKLKDKIFHDFIFCYLD